MYPERSGCLTKWEIKLGEHDIGYQPRASIKGRALADFLTKMPNDPRYPSTPTNGNVGHLQIPNQFASGCWTLYMDGESSKDSSWAGIILTNPQGDKSTYALKFKFKCLNNEVEIEAILIGLRLEGSMNVLDPKVFNDSMVMVNQMITKPRRHTYKSISLNLKNRSKNFQDLKSCHAEQRSRCLE